MLKCHAWCRLCFHAAALKQVPSCEFFPLEAVKTNIIGTDNVLTASIEYDVKKVICLSTDKAAYPINAMGISKAMMEKVFVAKSKQYLQRTHLFVVRDMVMLWLHVDQLFHYS